MLNPAMDCHKMYGCVTFLLICVPLVSAQCNFQDARLTLNNIQIVYDKFKTDMLNKSYTPKPSPQARICGKMESGSPEFENFENALANCSQSVQDGFQREWMILKAEHDEKCNGVCHLCSILVLSLLAWIAISLPQ